jgi:hypothetical protein
MFTVQTHHDLPCALQEIALDHEKRALIITRNRDTFMDQIDGASVGDINKPAQLAPTLMQPSRLLVLPPSRTGQADTGWSSLYDDGSPHDPDSHRTPTAP